MSSGPLQPGDAVLELAGESLIALDRAGWHGNTITVYKTP